MSMDEIRPLCDISDEELNASIEKLRVQGMSAAQIAETLEGKEASYRALTEDEIYAAYKRSEAAGIDPFETPEYLERVRRRNIADNEAYAQIIKEQLGGEE